MSNVNIIALVLTNLYIWISNPEIQRLVISFPNIITNKDQVIFRPDNSVRIFVITNRTNNGFFFKDVEIREVPVLFE